MATGNNKNLPDSLVNALRAVPTIDADAVIKELNDLIDTPNPLLLCPEIEGPILGETAQVGTTEPIVPFVFETAQLVEPNCKPRFPSKAEIDALVKFNTDTVTIIADKALAATRIGVVAGCEEDGLNRIVAATVKCKDDKAIAQTEFDELDIYTRDYFTDMVLLEYYIYVLILFAKKFSYNYQLHSTITSKLKSFIGELRSEITNKPDLIPGALAYRNSEIKDRVKPAIVERSEVLNKYFSYLSITYETFALDKYDVYLRDIENLIYDPEDLATDAQRLNISAQANDFKLKDLIELISAGKLITIDGTPSFVTENPPRTFADPGLAGGEVAPAAGIATGGSGKNPAKVIVELGTFDDKGNAIGNPKNDINNKKLFDQYVVKINTATNTVLNRALAALLDQLKAILSTVTLNNDTVGDIKAQPNVKEKIVQDYDYPFNSFSSINGQVDGIMLDHLNLFDTKPTPEEARTGKFAEIFFDRINTDVINNMFPTSNVVQQSMISVARVLSVAMRYGTDLTKFYAKMDQVKTRFIANKNKLVIAYNLNDVSYQKYQLLTRLKEIKICNDPIIKEPIDTTPAPVIEDLESKTFPPDDQPEMKDLKFWLKWCETLNVVSLLPQHYPIGLLIPSADGVTRVPLPTIWTPVSSVGTPSMLIVIFITITGIVVSPAIWVLQFKPIADATSKFLILFRGGNIKIKDQTKTNTLNPPIIDGIDINPELTKTLPFETDDLPSTPRMSIRNVLWVNYLNQWCAAAKTGNGFP